MDVYVHYTKRVKIDTIRKRLKAALDSKKIRYSEHEFMMVARDIYEFNNALCSGRSVFAKCVKEPRNLDSGHHYFEVWFVNHKGKCDIFWPCGSEIAKKYFCMSEQNRNHNLRKWNFTSGVIGMSRVLDATGAFSFRITELTGTRFQITSY